VDSTCKEVYVLAPVIAQASTLMLTVSAKTVLLVVNNASAQIHARNAILTQLYKEANVFVSLTM